MKLNDVCEFIVDCPHSTANDEGEGYPLIRTPNVGKGRLILDDVHRVSESVYNERNLRGTPKEDDLIFAREAPAGNVAVIKKGETVCLGQRTVLIRPNSKIVNPDFLTYYLLAPKQQHNLCGSANGSTVVHVNLPTIRNLPIDIPPLEIQNKIADILSAYDDLIENNQRQIKLLEEAAMRLYREWFVFLRFPGYKNVKIVDGVPEGWRKVLISEVICFDPDTPIEKNTDKISVPMSALSENNMTVNLNNTDISTSNSGSKFKNGDTLFARITPCLENGKTSFVYFLDDNKCAVGSTEFIVMRSKIINPYLVYCIARSEWFRNSAIKSMIGATGRQRVKRESLECLTYNLPTKEIIDAFEYQEYPIFKKIAHLSNQINKLRKARDELLPRLMDGGHGLKIETE